MTDGAPVQPGSLSSSLLARKGQARPAMRPQTAALHGGDDLGWNDMGDAPRVDPLPPVLLQRKALRAEFAEPALALGVPDKARAFTLRLDAERHLRLRLAAAIEGVSAQTLVTRALDQFLNSKPELEALARQVAPRLSRLDGESR